MITAEEARKLAKSFIEKEAEEILEEISSKIKEKAMEGGESICYRNTQIGNNLKEWKMINQKLIEAGFVVDLNVEDMGNTIFLDINWID